MNYTLVPLRRKDLTSIKSWRNEQKEILRQTKTLTDEDQENWFAKVQIDKHQVIFSILKDDELIGYCGITYVDHVNRRGEISFVAKTEITKDKKEYKKIFLAVLTMLKEYAFDKLKLHKLFTETFEFRDYHISILEEFGFQKDGKYKEHIWHEGRFIDSIIHSLINPND